MIFEPVNPIKFFFVTFQGLFMKRQKEVAKAYSEIFAAEILTTQNMFKTILNGSGSEKLIKIVESHIQEGVDKTAGLSSSLIQLTSGTRKYNHLKTHTTERFIEELVSIFPLFKTKPSKYPFLFVGRPINFQSEKYSFGLISI